jgi:hypothetical protein
MSLAACGGKSGGALVAPAMPTDVIPGHVDAAGGLTLKANTTTEVAKAFKSVGKTSLVKDGKVWDVRAGDRLVGMLELATISRRADTRDADDRTAIRRQILPGEPTELDFTGTPVYQSVDGSRNVFVWFGRQVFAALQLKGDLDADAVANELITVILQDNHWPGLPPDDFIEE